MNYRRGDIVLVLFPDWNLRTWKRRPALIVQADQLETGLPFVHADGKSGSGLGLLMDSLIMTDHLATIHDSEIDRVIGHLHGLAELDTALHTTLGL